MPISSDSTLRSFRPDTFAPRVFTNASSRSFSQIHPLTGTVSESLPLGFTFVWEPSRRMGTWSLITSQSLQTFQQGTLVLVISVTFGSPPFGTVRSSLATNSASAPPLGSSFSDPQGYAFALKSPAIIN
jgi:hypothetical protein